jgi:hypothetical protein
MLSGVVNDSAAPGSADPAATREASRRLASPPLRAFFLRPRCSAAAACSNARTVAETCSRAPIHCARVRGDKAS